MKIEQNPGCPNIEYNAIFEGIHQIIRASHRSIKNLHRSKFINILFHTENNLSKAICIQISVVCSKYILGISKS